MESKDNSTTDTFENLVESAKEKIKFGENLIKSIQKLDSVEGVQKLTRKINQELKFLRKVLRNKTLKKEHLSCSNLTHFAALVDTLKNVENCQSVNKVFLLGERKITVDLVCDNGLNWMKVIARNPKSVSQICMGNASYGVRSIIDQSEEYLECAKLYPCLFQTPKVIFVFTNGIGVDIANKLESNGILVRGTKIDSLISDANYDWSDDEEDVSLNRSDSPVGPELTTRNVSHINKVNLDVSAMLAYCSSVTNGSAQLYDFDVPVLKQQAEWERLRPQKPILDQFFEGKNLYCCQTARDNFENIVHTVAGPTEKVRAQRLLSRLTVLPDEATFEDTTEGRDESFDSVQFAEGKSLSVGGKIRQRSLVIFTFGDRIQAVTVTANDGFVRAAKQQGINFAVFVHESRALTEQKEKLRAKALHT